jgi:predicted nucleotidyltransferase
MDHRSAPDLDRVVYRFAERLRATHGATRVLLFGSYARGNAYYDSDYDFIIVSPQFEDVHRLKRGIGLWDVWSEVGGRAPTDFICLTPEEFETASHRITLIQAVLPEAIDLLPAAVLV